MTDVIILVAAVFSGTVGLGILLALACAPRDPGTHAAPRGRRRASSEPEEAAPLPPDEVPPGDTRPDIPAVRDEDEPGGAPAANGRVSQILLRPDGHIKVSRHGHVTVHPADVTAVDAIDAISLDAALHVPPHIAEHLDRVMS